MKYIIEVEDECTEGLYRAKGFKTLVFDDAGLKKLEPVSGALQHGYDDGYQDGLNDAWECIKGIEQSRTDDEWEDFYSYLGVEKYQPWRIFEKYSAAEAIAKFKEYKKDTSRLSKIHLVCAENDSGTLKFTFSNGVMKAIRIEDLLNKDNPDCKVIARGVPITHAVYSSNEKKGESDDNN